GALANRLRSFCDRPRSGHRVRIDRLELADRCVVRGDKGLFTGFWGWVPNRPARHQTRPLRRGPFRECRSSPDETLFDQVVETWRSLPTRHEATGVDTGPRNRSPHPGQEFVANMLTLHQTGSPAR